MPATAIKIGPKDNGRRMSLEDFNHAEVLDGYLYELGRGVITVSDVPNKKHMDVTYGIKEDVIAYKLSFPGIVHRVLSGSECKLLLADLESERHPDLSVYKTPPPAEDDFWSTWIPELVIEVVSPFSAQRDYVEKREEYLAFGVKEYWIVDAERQEMLVLTRFRGKWRERVVRPGEVYESKLFPGFQFDLAKVLGT